MIRLLHSFNRDMPRVKLNYFYLVNVCIDLSWSDFIQLLHRFEFESYPCNINIYTYTFGK
jgi:hypothetical protein